MCGPQIHCAILILKSKLMHLENLVFAGLTSHIVGVIKREYSRKPEHCCLVWLLVPKTLSRPHPVTPISGTGCVHFRPHFRDRQHTAFQPGVKLHFRGCVCEFWVSSTQIIIKLGWFDFYPWMDSFSSYRKADIQYDHFQNWIEKDVTRQDSWIFMV